MVWRRGLLGHKKRGRQLRKFWFTAWGVAGIIGPRMAECCMTDITTIRLRFTLLRWLAGVALLCELGARGQL